MGADWEWVVRLPGGPSLFSSKAMPTVSNEVLRLEGLPL